MVYRHRIDLFLNNETIEFNFDYNYFNVILVSVILHELVSSVSWLEQKRVYAVATCITWGI